MIIINHIDFILYFCYNLFNLQLNIDNLYQMILTGILEKVILFL